MKKLWGSLPFRLLLGVVLGILLGQVAGVSVMNVVVTVKYVIGQLINFCVPLIIIGFIAPSIAKMGANASQPSWGVAILCAYVSSILAALLSMGAGYAIIPASVHRLRGGRAARAARSGVPAGHPADHERDERAGAVHPDRPDRSVDARQDFRHPAGRVPEDGAAHGDERGHPAAAAVYRADLLRAVLSGHDHQTAAGVHQGRADRYGGPLYLARGAVCSGRRVFPLQPSARAGATTARLI